MATSGLLSILCALGTIIGIALFVIGLLTKEGKPKRIGGALLFVLSFSGLFYLLANFGSFDNPEEGTSLALNQGERYQVYRYDRMSMNSEELTPQIEPLLDLLHPPIDVYVDSMLTVYSSGRMVFERGLIKEDSTWKMIGGSEHLYTPFHGEFALDEDHEFIILSKQLPSTGGLELSERLMLLK